MVAKSARVHRRASEIDAAQRQQQPPAEEPQLKPLAAQQDWPQAQTGMTRPRSVLGVQKRRRLLLGAG